MLHGPPIYPPRLDYSNYTWRRLQITKHTLHILRLCSKSQESKQCFVLVYCASSVSIDKIWVWIYEVQLSREMVYGWLIVCYSWMELVHRFKTCRTGTGEGRGKWSEFKSYWNSNVSIVIIKKLEVSRRGRVDWGAVNHFLFLALSIHACKKCTQKTYFAAHS
jgi:hypothetical protein